MASVQAGARFTIKNVLYLTDFSEPSDAVLPFAATVAREYGSKIYALHVMIPQSYVYLSPDILASIDAQEEAAQEELKRVDSALSGLSHDCVVERGSSVWPSVEDFVHRHPIDLIVLGTHGRTGSQKLLLGSVAEEVFRSSSLPVLTVGPGSYRKTHRSARFHTVLFASDLRPTSGSAAPYAISMAEENEARLILLHVIKHSEAAATDETQKDAVAHASCQLYRLVPPKAAVWCKPEAIVRVGDPAQKILEVAGERNADLIVLGLHDCGSLGAATHLGTGTAHKIVSQAPCPVLTVRR